MTPEASGHRSPSYDSPAQAHTYTVAETDFAVRLLQPCGSEKHATFLVHDRESLSYHYERNRADPRVSHIAVSNPVRSISVAYEKRIQVGVKPDGSVRTSFPFNSRLRQ